MAGVPQAVAPYDPFSTLNENNSALFALLSDLPFFNIKDSPYNAAVDGVTDDTNAVQSAITDANAQGGGIVQFPAGTCVCASALSLNGTTGVWLRGVGQSKNTVPGGSVLKFTGSGAGSFITGSTSKGSRVSNLYVYSSNVGFSGKLLNFDSFSGPLTIEDCTIGSTTDTSGVLLSINNGVIAKIARNTFLGGVVQIAGLAIISDFSNVVTVEFNSFQSYTTAAIKNPGGQKWTIRENTFEPGAGNIQKALQITVLQVVSLTFSNNWLGDSTANNQNFVELQAVGLVLHGNYVSAVSGTGNTAFKLVGNVTGMHAAGNQITSNPQTAFDFFGGTALLSNGLVVEGNEIDSATPFTALPPLGTFRFTNNNGAAGLIAASTAYQQIQNTTAAVYAGANTPEGAVTAPIGSIFLRTNGGAATTLYVKESGAGNVGWVAK